MSSSDSNSEIVMELAEEFLDRYRRGERPPLAEYALKHPNLADEIREVFPAMAMMENIAIDDESLAAEKDQSVAVSELEQLGDFRIIREVGRGGMGVVYEAEQVSLGRHVALKVLPSSALPDSKHVRRFEREAKSAAKLHHTNIVPVFGVGEQDGMHYYVMQFIQGLPLDEVIDELKKIQDQPSGTIASSVTVDKTGSFERQKSVADVAHSLMTGQFAETYIGESDSEADSSEKSGTDSAKDDSSASRLSETMNLSGSLSGSTLQLGKSGVHTAPQKQFTYWQSVANIGAQVADALQYAHEQGILHRDIKPSNLLLDLRGTTWVTDFGLAKATDQQDITHTGDILGTLRYMPPEAFDGIADARSDVYSLGLTMYELLAFQPAFDIKQRHQLIKQVTTEAAPRLDKINPQIPRDLVTIIHKAIDRDPSHRYQTAEEMQEDLHRYLADEPIKARRVSLGERLTRWSRRNKGLATSLAAIAVLLLIINVAGPLFYWRLHQQKEELADKKQELDDSYAELKLTKDNEKTQYELRLSEQEQKNKAIAALLQAEQTTIAAQKNEMRALDDLKATVTRQKRDIYAGDMMQVALEAQRGNLTRVREILLAYISFTEGETDLRGPEWYYWYNFLNQASESGKKIVTAGETVPAMFVFPGGDLVGVAREGAVEIFERTEAGFDLTQKPSYSVPTDLEASRLFRNPVTTSGLVVEDINPRLPNFALRTESRPNVRRRPNYVPPPETFHLWGRDKSQEFKFPEGAFTHLSYLAVSPDDRFVAALGVSNEDLKNPICRILIWSVATGKLLVDVERPGELTRMKFNHDGSLLAGYLAHGSLRRLDDERDVVVVFELSGTEENTEAREIGVARHNDDVDSVYFIPGRREVLLGTLGFSGNVRKEIYRWTIGGNDLRRVGYETMPDLPQGEISPDGRLFAVSAPWISTIRLIDLQTGKTVKTLYNSEGYKIDSLTFSVNGERLIACGKLPNSAAMLEWRLEQPDWYAMQNQPVNLPRGIGAQIYSEPIHTISPDQSLLAYFDETGLTLRPRQGDPQRFPGEVNTGDLFHPPVNPRTKQLSFSSDSQFLAEYSMIFNSKERVLLQLVSLYKRDGETGMKLECPPIEVARKNIGATIPDFPELAFSADNQLLLKRWGRVHVIDFESKQVTELRLPEKVSRMDPAERTPLISAFLTDPGTGTTCFAVLEPSTVKMDEDASGLSGEDSTEGPTEVSNLWTIHLFDGDRGASIAEREVDIQGRTPSDIQEIVLAADQRHVGILWKTDRRIQILDLEDEGSSWELSGDGAVFSPDSSLLTVYSHEQNPPSIRIRNVSVWDLRQRTEISNMSLLGTGAEEIRYSPDSQRILTLHGVQPSGSADVAAEVRVWDVRSGHELLSIPVENVNHYYWDIAFDPTDDRLTSLTILIFAKRVTGRDSSVATIYDLTRGSEDAELLLVAEPEVRTLFEKYRLKGEVLSKLAANDEYIPRFKAKAEELARGYPEDDLDAITNACLKLMIGGHDQPDSVRYQSWAETFHNQYPEDPRTLLICGISEYYNGNMERALNLLAAKKSPPDQSATVLSPEQALAGQLFRTLTLLKADRTGEAEQAALDLDRTLRREFGINCFAEYSIQIPSDTLSISSLIQNVQRQISDRDSNSSEEGSASKKMAANILYVLDLDSDGVLTEADDLLTWEAEAAHDWETLSRLDRNSDSVVSADELEQLTSLALEGLNHSQETIVLLTRSMLRVPLYYSYWSSRASRYRDQDEYAAALADLDVAERLAPGSSLSFVRNLRGLIHCDRGDWETAKSIFEEINQLDSEWAAAWNNHGWACENLGEKKLAIKYYSRAVELDRPNPYPTAFQNRIRLSLEFGDREQALQDYNQVIALEATAANYQKRGDVQLMLGDYQAAIDDFKKAIELDSKQNSYRERLILARTLKGDQSQAAESFEKLLDEEADQRKKIELIERFTEIGLDLSGVLKDRPENPVLLSLLARKQSAGEDSSQFAELMDRAQRLAREQFAAAPDSEVAAVVWATVELNSLGQHTQWTILKSEEKLSAGEASLELLEDGSILASGTNTEQEVYTINAHPGQKEITCLALETLPHASFTAGNSGRSIRLGNFLISEFKVAVLDNAGDSEPREISIRRFCSDYIGRGGAKTSWIENMFESTAGKHWTAWPDVHLSHRIVFELQQPIAIPENGSLQITIDCRDPEYPQHALGRFRLSVTDSPTAFEQEQKRLAVFKIDDAWEQLAALYQLTGRVSERDHLLAQRPEAALGVASFLADTGNGAESADYLKKLLEQLHHTELPQEEKLALFRACGAMFLRAGDWGGAARAREARLELITENASIEWMLVAGLYAYADDEEEYLSFCTRMLDHFRDSTNPGEAERTLKSMILMPNGFESQLDPDRAPVARFLKALSQKGSITVSFETWFKATRALLACRAEKFGGLAEAQRWVDESKGGPEFTEGYVGLLQMSVQALILAKQGKTDEAQQLVDDTALRMKNDYSVKWLEDGRLDGRTIVNGDGMVHDLVIAEVIRREVQRMIRDDHDKVTSTKKPVRERVPRLSLSGISGVMRLPREFKSTFTRVVESSPLSRPHTGQ